MALDHVPSGKGKAPLLRKPLTPKKNQISKWVIPKYCSKGYGGNIKSRLWEHKKEGDTSEALTFKLSL